MKTLKETPVGATVRVVKLHSEGTIKRRLMDLQSVKAFTAK